jgi:hypothetical protein
MINCALICLLLFALVECVPAESLSAANPCPNAMDVPPDLKLPATLPPGEPVDFEQKVRSYLGSLKYRELKWCEDVSMRDTGPYIKGAYYGTHPAVRVYYSREVSDWLLHGRRGTIPDGAVIIKEQYNPPAQPYADLYGDKTPGCPNDWTFMIRNSKASKDGWFWGEVWYSADPNRRMKFHDPYQYPNAGYGLYCLRCHSSAEKEHTFAALDNMRNYAGADGQWPLRFRADDSWIKPGWQKAYTLPERCGDTSTAPGAELEAAVLSSHAENMELRGKLFVHPGRAVAIVPDRIQTFPPETWDQKLSGPGGPPWYVTSDQCTGCHSALPATNAFGPAMFLAGSKDGFNASEYGEWRWSPMGLAGRDPVFFAQAASERSFFSAPAQKQTVVNICMNCHGAMGLKSYYLDHGLDPNNPPTTGPVLFNADWPFLRDAKDPGFQYGGMARDGISCAVCHHMAPPPQADLTWFLNNYTNGRYKETDPAKMQGPFDPVTEYPMDQALGIKPKPDDFIKSSRMCGVCHTINLPVMDSPKPNEMSVEQATYLEWLNSDFQNEYGRGSKAQTCQECHMPTGYTSTAKGIDVKAIQTRIAIVEDATFPAAEHSASPNDLNVRYRGDGYMRHEFLGMNGILLQMFQQFVDANKNNPILGVRLADYMSGQTTDLPDAVANIVQQAALKTAQVSIGNLAVQNGLLTADVRVQNLAGHRLPSGVGFRRAFVEFVVYRDGQPIFSSGRTNDKGEIVDADDKVLPTEYFAGGQYQPHFDVAHPITSSEQVEIYQELIQDVQHHFTTSFLKRDYIIKDNRLLPTGWTKEGPPGAHIPEYFLESTMPIGVAGDPAYADGSGTSVVRYRIAVPAGVEANRFRVTATLEYQSTPPFFFADRFQTTSPATERMKYLVDNLQLDGTEFQSWKLPIASASATGE